MERLEVECLGKRETNLSRDFLSGARYVAAIANTGPSNVNKKYRSDCKVCRARQEKLNARMHRHRHIVGERFNDIRD